MCSFEETRYRILKESRETTELSSENRKNTFVDLIQDKKGKDIVSLDLRAIPEAVADFFIICHGDSTTQVKAIIDYLRDETKKQKLDTIHGLEGLTNSEWALIDFGDIVIHVFLRDIRNLYQLEELWSDALVKEYENVV